MTVKLSQESFVALLVKSRLISEDALSGLVDEFRAEQPEAGDEGERFAQFLVRKGRLTTWQAKKLLQGKHKGFTLGKYKLLSLLGRGGMSSVYLAEHLLMKRRCAIKVLPSKQVKDVAALNRFHQEAQAVAALDDPNIVRAYDVDHVTEGTSDIHFLVMEYVEGRSLQEVVEEDGPLGIANAIDYVCQAASGLDHAHQVGMVHRDIKPSNLLLDLAGTVKVLDMGLARFFEQTDQQSLTLQHDQRVLGTADYLSPEQAVDSHGVDTRSDIYSLGGTLYFLFTGHPPFPEGTLAQRLLAHQTRAPKPVTDERPDVPASLARILERMMAKSRDDRQSTVGEARDELQRWLKQHGDSIPRTGVKPSRRKQPRKAAEPTAAGWGDPAPDRFTPPAEGDTEFPLGKPGDSNVVSDPNLGEFLTALSTEVDPALADSDGMGGARTVVSKTQPKRIPPDIIDLLESSDSHVTSGSSVRPEVGGSTSRRRKQAGWGIPVPVVAGGAGVLVLLLIGFMVWPSADQAAPGQQAGTNVENGTLPSAENPPEPSPDARPAVDPGSDITVGPEGNFATITEAITYVRSHFRPLSPDETQSIRVAGGETYPERVEIDNSDFSFPQGVRIICEGDAPAVLAPPGTKPIVTLLNVEEFQLQGFELAGSGRPIAMRLEGYISRSTFENLTIRDVQVAAIRASEIASAGGQIEIRDLLVHRSAAEAVGLALGSSDHSTKELLIRRCRFGGKLAAGIRFEGEVTNVDIKECRFSDIAIPIQFAEPGQDLDQISLTNNTFHRFDQAISFAGPPDVGGKGIGFHKNLFVDGRGPEVAIEQGGEGLTPADLVKHAGARFNWSDGPAELADQSVDIFLNNGRRGAEKINFVGTDAENAGRFLKPRGDELRISAGNAPNPWFIGAVPPEN